MITYNKDLETFLEYVIKNWPDSENQVEYNCANQEEYLNLLEWKLQLKSFDLIKEAYLENNLSIPKNEKRYHFFNKSKKKIHFITIKDFIKKTNLKEKLVKCYLINKKRKSYNNWIIL